MITIRVVRSGRRALSFVLLPLSIVLLSAACASTPPNRSSLLQFTPAARSAGLIPGSWEKVEGLRLGSSLVVTLKTGDRLGGALKALTLGALTLTDPTGKEFMVPRSEVGRIVAQMTDDLTNGALIGAGVGLSAALVVLAIAGSRDGYVLPSAKWGAPLLLSGLGSLGGMLVDRVYKREEMVYLAP
jgi:ABC-type Fe3+-hydroxamate transport system substrate-binding protein